MLVLVTFWSLGCASPIVSKETTLGKSSKKTDVAKLAAKDPFPTAAEVGLANNDEPKKSDK